jgi:hypothetical protein
MLLLLFRCHTPIRSHAASFSSSEGYIRGGARSRNHVTISHVLHASICAPVHGRPHSGAMAVEDSPVESQFDNAQVILDEFENEKEKGMGGVVKRAPRSASYIVVGNSSTSASARAGTLGIRNQIMKFRFAVPRGR